MTFEQLKSLFLTNLLDENKSGTSFLSLSSLPTDHSSSEGGSLYISNCPPAGPPNEKLNIAYEVRELMLLLLESGETASHDELHFVLFMMECLIENIENDLAGQCS